MYIYTKVKMMIKGMRKMRIMMMVMMVMAMITMMMVMKDNALQQLSPPPWRDRSGLWRVSRWRWCIWGGSSRWRLSRSTRWWSSRSSRWRSNDLI